MLAITKISFGATGSEGAQSSEAPVKKNKPNVDIRKIKWVFEQFKKPPLYVKKAPDVFQEDAVGVPFVEPNGMFVCEFRYDPETNEKQKVTYEYGNRVGVSEYSITTYFDDGVKPKKEVLLPGSCNGKPLCYKRFDEYGDIVRKITRNHDGTPIHQFKSMYSIDDDELCQLEYSGIELVNIANYKNGKLCRQVEFEKEKRKNDDINLPFYDRSDDEFALASVKSDDCHYCRAKRITTYDPETKLSTTVYIGDDYIPPSKYVTNDKDELVLHEMYHHLGLELAERTTYDENGKIATKDVFDPHGELLLHHIYTHSKGDAGKNANYHNVFEHKKQKKNPISAFFDKIKDKFN